MHLVQALVFVLVFLVLFVGCSSFVKHFGQLWGRDKRIGEQEAYVLVEDQVQCLLVRRC